MATASAPENGAPTLERVLGLPLLTFYGLGTIVGAGIYVLLGKVAGEAGSAAPLSFLLAAIVAALTATSYSALSAQIPVSAGEAAYVRAAFHRGWLTAAVGWGVALTGTISGAAIAKGFVGYAQVFVDVPGTAIVCVLILTLGGVAAWGIGVSARIAAAVTVIEIGGLGLVLVIGAEHLATLPERWPELLPTAEAAHRAGSWAGVGLGAALAFYAFIGFEDMVNVAEEARSPERDFPRAIFLALGISSVLYLLVVILAVLALPSAALAATDAPLAAIVAASGSDPRSHIAAISLLAVTNGALVQIIRSSRVCYGMAKQGNASPILAYVHPRRRTPLVATALVTATVLGFALWLPVEDLALVTSLVVLAVFALVNAAALALWAESRRHLPRILRGRWIPLAGVAACTLLLGYQLLARI